MKKTKEHEQQNQGEKHHRGNRWRRNDQGHVEDGQRKTSLPIS